MVSPLSGLRDRLMLRRFRAFHWLGQSCLAVIGIPVTHECLDNIQIKTEVQSEVVPSFDYTDSRDHLEPS